MQVIREKTARAFKSLAGIDKDEPATSWVFAVYVFLVCVAFVLVVLWLSGAEV